LGTGAILEVLAYILDIKPIVFPASQTTRIFVLDIVLVHLLPKLEPRSFDYIDVFVVVMGFQMEEMTKKILVGLDAKECFSQLNKNGNMQDRVEWKYARYSWDSDGGSDTTVVQ